MPFLCGLDNTKPREARLAPGFSSNLYRSSRREFYNSRPLTPPGIRFRTTAVHINTGTVGDTPAVILAPFYRTTLS